MCLTEPGRILVIAELTKQLKVLEDDLTVGNYFDRIDRINAIKAQLVSLQESDHQ